MPLIDRSYFIGELNIAGSDRAPVQEVIDWFIAKYEPELLRRLLGVNLYNAFITGLQESSPDARWTDLLNGKEYTYGGITKRWRGIISEPGAVVNVLQSVGSIAVIVGRGQLESNGYPADDPVAGATNVNIPSSLIGKDFIVVQRAFGELRADEYEIVNGTVFRLKNWTFGLNDTYFFKSATLTINTTAGLNKESLIANYVYYWYMRNLQTQTTVSGEVVTTNENSSGVSAAHKAARAAYECDRWTWEMRDFLNSNSSTYPEWTGTHCQPLWANAFGI